MPVVEYILLGLLGASSALGPKPITVGAEAIVQPNGGVPAAASQARPKKQACDAGSKDAAKLFATVKGGTRSQNRRTRHHKVAPKTLKHGSALQK